MASIHFERVRQAVRNLESIKPYFDEMLVIDCHGHVGPHSRFFVPEDDIDHIAGVMDSLGIDMISLNVLAALEGDYKAGNDMTARAVQKYPDRIIGHCCINPNYPEDVENETIRCFEELGARILKFHCAWHNTPPEHEHYRPAIEYCAEHRIPLVSHLPHYVNDLPGYAELAAQYPQMPFIVAHSTAPEVIDPIIEICLPVENMYFDTCGYAMHNHSIERLVNAVGEDRVLWGSDVAWLNTAYQLGDVLFADISDDAREKMLGLNFNRLMEDIKL